MTIGSAVAFALETLDELGSESTCQDICSCVALLDHLQCRLDSWYLWFRSLYVDARLFTAPHGESMLRFVDTPSANGLTHYWAFSLIFSKYREDLALLCQAVGQRPDDDVSRPRAVETRRALYILGSVQYLTQENQKLFGAASLGFPLRVGYEYLGITGYPQLLEVRHEAIGCLKKAGYQFLVTCFSPWAVVLRELGFGHSHCNNSQ